MIKFGPDTVVSRIKRVKRAEVLKWMRTIALVMTMGVMGLDSNLSRSIRPDLLVRLNTTADTMAYVGAVGGIGGLLVPPLAVLFDKLGGYEEIMTGICHFFGAFTMVAKAYTLTIWVHTFYSFIESSIFYGLLFSVCNSVVSRLWGKKSGRPMQALNLGWPIGSIIGPLIAVPFVSEPVEDMTNSTTTSPFVTEPVNVTDSEPLPPLGTYSRDFPDDSQIEIACWIAACLTIFVGSIHFALFVVIRIYYTDEVEDDNTGDQNNEYYHSSSGIEANQVTNENNNGKNTCSTASNQSTNDIEEESNDNETNSNILSWRDIMTPSKWAAGDGPFGVKVAVLTVLFYMLLMFSAKGVGGYLVLYAVDSGLGFTNAEAARLQSSVFVFAIIGDTTAMFLAKYLSVNWMLFIQVHGQLVAGFLMLGLGTRTKVGLWVTSCFYTAVREPSFASGYTWSGLHIILYAFILSMISLILGVTNIPMNALQGWLYTNTVIESIFYTTIFWGGINCFALYVMIYLTYNREPIQSILAKKAEEETQSDKNTASKRTNANEDGVSDTSCDSDNSSSPLQHNGQMQMSALSPNHAQDQTHEIAIL